MAVLALPLAIAVIPEKRHLPLAIAWCAILIIGSWERHGNWVFERPLGTDTVTKGLLIAESPYNLGHAHHLYDDLKRARHPDGESVP